MTTTTPGPEPELLRTLARRLLVVAAGASEAAAGYEHLHDGRWKGPAADSARARLASFTHPLRRCVDSLTAAAGALLVHATACEEAVAYRHRADDLDRQWRATVDREQVEWGRPLSLGPHPEVHPTAGPGDAVAAQLRAVADELLAQSSRTTGALLLRLAQDVPTLAPFHPRNLGGLAAAAGLEGMADELGWLGLGLRADAAVVRYIAQNPDDVRERVAADYDAHGGATIDGWLTAVGVVPGAGVVTSSIQGVIDIARGHDGEAFWDSLGVFPGLGLLTKTARATRTARTAGHVALAERGLAALGKGYGHFGEGKLAKELVSGSAPTKGTPALVRPGEAAAQVMAATTGTGVPLPSQSLAYTLVANPDTRWEAVKGSYAPHPLFGPGSPGDGASTWRGTVDVAQAGQVVTYTFTATRTGAVLGEPTVLRQRPVTAETAEPGRRGRALAFVSAAEGPAGRGR